MKGEIRMCPQCGSAGVDFSQLACGEARCRGCHWEGPREELLVTPIDHDFLASEAALAEMANDMRQLLSGELGLPYLKFLLKWGFLDADATDLVHTLDRKQFSRYLTAIANSVLTSVLTERSLADARKVAVEEIGMGRIPNGKN